MASIYHRLMKLSAAYHSGYPQHPQLSRDGLKTLVSCNTKIWNLTFRIFYLFLRWEEGRQALLYPLFAPPTSFSTLLTYKKCSINNLLCECCGLSLWVMICSGYHFMVNVAAEALCWLHFLCSVRYQCPFPSVTLDNINKVIIFNTWSSPTNSI